jgi:tetratricopeptide (TPR) repeat protein
VRSAAAMSLGEIGNNHAIEPLAALLRDKDEARYDAAKALGRIGDSRAAKQLLATLKDENERILVRKYAYEALVKIVSKLPLLSRQSSAIDKTGDTYVDDCFYIECKEVTDDRDWREIPEAKALTALGPPSPIVLEENDEERLCRAEKLRLKYPDYWFPYYWLGRLNAKRGRFHDAHKYLLEGLQLAKKKYPLFEAMADLDWQPEKPDSGNLAEAVKWWIRSIINQVGIADTKSSWRGSDTSFLYVSYIAEELGLYEESFWLRLWVDRFTPGMVRLEVDYVDRVRSATLAQRTVSMKKAISLLCRTYLSRKEISMWLGRDAQRVLQVTDEIWRSC